MASIHPHCQQTGSHDWVMIPVDGWFFCQRSRCAAYATCPACLGVRVVDTHIRFCLVHLELAPFAEEYPLATPVSLDAVPVLEQRALW